MMRQAARRLSTLETVAATWQGRAGQGNSLALLSDRALDLLSDRELWAIVAAEHGALPDDPAEIDAFLEGIVHAQGKAPAEHT